MHKSDYGSLPWQELEVKVRREARAAAAKQPGKARQLGASLSAALTRRLKTHLTAGVLARSRTAIHKAVYRARGGHARNVFATSGNAAGGSAGGSADSEHHVLVWRLWLS